jgi:hypothetical protein
MGVNPWQKLTDVGPDSADQVKTVTDSLEAANRFYQIVASVVP